MEIIFSENAMQELEYWKKSGDVVILKKIRKLNDAGRSCQFIRKHSPV